jgi:Ni,Fe-hydrogenase I cytochrome b subunit
MSDISINETLKQNPEYRIKSYTMTIVLIVIVIGFILLVGAFGPDFFAILIFLIIMAIPVILLLRNKLINILPSFLSNNLLEIDHGDKQKQTVKYNPSKYTKQVGLYIMIVFMLIGSGLFLKKGNSEIEEWESLYKILGGLICLIIGGSILLEIDYIE